jgi:flavin-dependent dehydrogenase
MSDYDVVTVGGGLGGAALAKVLAEAGRRVLVLERTSEFKDRVRGEVLVAAELDDLERALGHGLLLIAWHCAGEW